MKPTRFAEPQYLTDSVNTIESALHTTGVTFFLGERALQDAPRFTPNPHVIARTLFP
jgi:hypothetical protein